MGSTLMAPFCRNLQYRAEPPNQFNSGLDTEALIWRYILTHGGLRSVCPGKKKAYQDSPWNKMPPDGIKISKPFSISLPANDGADHLVGSFQVPIGWNLSLPQVIHFWTGTTFVEGSGDLTWRYRINQHYVKDFGNVQVSEGSFVQPSPARNGEIHAYSGDVVYGFVNQATTSSLSGGRIVMGFLGWRFPTK